MRPGPRCFIKAGKKAFWERTVSFLRRGNIGETRAQAAVLTPSQENQGSQGEITPARRKREEKSLTMALVSLDRAMPEAITLDVLLHEAVNSSFCSSCFESCFCHRRLN